jgi:DNA primase
LRFAFLPEGQDPDDLVRQAGPEAMAAVLAAALPLIDVLWGRALELPRQTPEQRAALETVVEQYVAAVADTKVREHYSRALTDRLWRLWRGNRRERPAAGGRGRAPARGAGRWPLQAPVPAGPSPELRASPLSRDRPGGYHAREALILVTLVNHPALAEAHAEEIADLEFTHRDLDSLRQRIIDIAASAAPLDGAVMRAQLRKQGLAPLLERLDRAVALRGDWFARSDAALADAEIGWRHVLGRQHKASDLRRELDAAERALGEDPSESNEIRLARARSDLEAFEGNEVRIEGYGRDPSRVPEGGSFAEWVEANRHRLP